MTDDYQRQRERIGDVVQELKSLPDNPSFPWPAECVSLYFAGLCVLETELVGLHRVYEASRQLNDAFADLDHKQKAKIDELESRIEELEESKQ